MTEYTPWYYKKPEAGAKIEGYSEVAEKFQHYLKTGEFMPPEEEQPTVSQIRDQVVKDFNSEFVDLLNEYQDELEDCQDRFEHETSRLQRVMELYTTVKKELDTAHIKLANLKLKLGADVVKSMESTNDQ